ncbi:D-alanyl-D-alanine carboxypeptidase family protein [Clostridium chromiireducens]|uniref:D-alanyl-D-alanine carboxypeptidase family protein n=1 Tax=Clostridium chromiireducens TaxID=225345 RepID=A0A964RQS9_9CLOT|nr:M15 family metallopeptidase [Clostridium chromiireducens]MVX66254.1 D-alanyl-D-alanine carboxypeptidase family protein [Clostridium chromiireducens]
MRNRFGKFLIVIITICGTWYIIQCAGLGLNLKSIISEGSKIYLSENDKSSDANNINIDKELVLVNSEHGLDKYYKPESLTIPDISFASGVSQEEKHVAGIIERPLEELVDAAKKDGVILFGNSGYRSYKSQENTYSNRVKSQGEKLADAYVAKPGFSEHQTGLCIDITNQNKNLIKGTKEANWLAENCYKFGFIIRYHYGKKSITGIEYEPWHIRYVGKNAAKYIYDNEITLEEYLGK